jgi:ribosomal protein S18 acetylase RimI-like enzyme
VHRLRTDHIHTICAPHPAMLLRPALATDHTALARIWCAAWASANPQVPATHIAPPEHWLARVREELWAPSTMLTIVAESADQQVQGFLSVDTVHSYLAQLHVAPGHQGRSIGSRLVQHLMDTLCPQGGSLYVAQDNVRARHFYQRHGLSELESSLHPVTGRRRVLCVWRAAAATATNGTETPLPRDLQVKSV